MCRARALRGIARDEDFIGICEQHHRRQAHDAAVTCRAGIRGAAERVTGRFVVVERTAHRGANVETAAIAAQIALRAPARVAFHLIPRIEAACFDQAGREAERHGGIVGPFPWL